MKSKHHIMMAAAVALIALAVFAFWNDSFQETGAGTPDATDSPQAAQPLIITAQPVFRTFTLRIPWTGTVEAQASVELTALVAGRVEEIQAGDQRPIEKGRCIIRLGGPQIEEARAKLTAEIESLTSQIDRSRQTVERLEQTLKTRLATKNQIAAAQDAQVRLETQLRKTRLNQKTLEAQINISAPMDGIFTKRRVSVGQDVQAGQVVGEVIDTDRLRIVASIFPPRGISLQGMEASVALTENETLKGLVQSVLPQASNTGAVTVWIESPRIDARLHPGQMISGDVVVKVKSDALAVPESAIVYDSQEHPYLFVSKGDSYEPVDIRTGLAQDGWVEVLSGLKQDQLVVTRGAYELFYRKFNEQFKAQD